MENGRKMKLEVSHMVVYLNSFPFTFTYKKHKLVECETWPFYFCGIFAFGPMNLDNRNASECLAFKKCECKFDVQLREPF